jgi:hypothetical protein
MRPKDQPISEYLPKQAMMTLWAAVHLGVSPASRTIQRLDGWQIGLIYETVMNYPLEGLRRCYFDRKKSIDNIDDDDLLDFDMGYSPDEIAEIKGKG